MEKGKRKGPTKLPGKFIHEWNLSKTPQGDENFITTKVPKKAAEILEYWSPFLKSEGKISNNSSFKVARYLLINAAEALDRTYQDKYGPRRG